MVPLRSKPCRPESDRLDGEKEQAPGNAGSVRVRDESVRVRASRQASVGAKTRSAGQHHFSSVRHPVPRFTPTLREEAGMQVIVKGHNVHVSEQLKELAIHKLEKVKRFFDRIQSLEVEFSEEHNPRIAD